MKLERKRDMKVNIPTASMSDIAFLLLIFFMVTTVFRKEIGLKVILPSAKTTERLIKQRDLSHIYVDKDGRISVDDKIVTPEQVKVAFKIKLSENPSTIAYIKADKRVEYKYVNDVMDALRDAQAFRVVFATLYPKK